MPAVRAAVERHWLDTQRVAASVLGDEALAAEIMETAIEQAVAYLTDHPPKSQEDVNAAPPAILEAGGPASTEKEQTIRLHRFLWCSSSIRSLFGSFRCRRCA